MEMKRIIVKSPDLLVDDVFRLKYTGRGDDLSPELILEGVPLQTKSMVIIMDDIKHHTLGVFNHWTIWNLPRLDVIPMAIPHGSIIKEFSNAQQGIGYGVHRYAGPCPPKGTQHEYRFTVYALDTILSLSSDSGKDELLLAMNGHVIAQGLIEGKFEKDLI